MYSTFAGLPFKRADPEDSPLILGFARRISSMRKVVALWQQSARRLTGLLVLLRLTFLFY